MKFRSLPFWLGLALVTIYGFRSVTGIAGGIAFTEGTIAAAAGHHDTALPFLERAAVGFNRSDALWLEAEVRVALYDMLQGVPDSEEEQDRLLEEARLGYQAAIEACPVSGWSWEGLADLYFRLEERRRAREGFDLALITRPPWERIGDEGKLAFGFLIGAIAKEPAIYLIHEDLVVRSIQFGLEELATDALMKTAAQQPDFWLYEKLKNLDDPDLLALFASVSESMVDQAPLISRERHMFSLGKLFRHMGDLPKAERYLRAAAMLPSPALNHAEDAFHLARVLMEQGRYDEALVQLDEAAQSEAFQFAVYSNRAEIARRKGEFELAFDYLGRCRRMAPKSTRFALAYSAVAIRLERFDAAEQALKWATMIDPENSMVWSELVGFYLLTENRVEARNVLRDAATHLGPEHPEILRLSGDLAASLNDNLLGS